MGQWNKASTYQMSKQDLKRLNFFYCGGTNKQSTEDFSTESAKLPVAGAIPQTTTTIESVPQTTASSTNSPSPTTTDSTTIITSASTSLHNPPTESVEVTPATSVASTISTELYTGSSTTESEYPPSVS